MFIAHTPNVRDALPKLVGLMLELGEPEATRLGPVLALPEPITVVYDRPKEHVLLNPIRDANPFFHLLEAMWMLAGRNDAQFLTYYIKDYAERYAIDGKIPDAYGHRWRYGMQYDQIEIVISQLLSNPATRQAVLLMWGAGRNDLIEAQGKPCNLAISFRIHDNKLNMTVFNRSNDLIWGACGANAVHFALLQEYIAACVGVEMGRYWQVSNNLHFYIEHREMLERRIENLNDGLLDNHLVDPLCDYQSTMPLVDDPPKFLTELFGVMERIDFMQKTDTIPHHDTNEYYLNTFLGSTVLPMAIAHMHFKKKRYADALYSMSQVKALDWKRAGVEWIQRRNK